MAAAEHSVRPDHRLPVSTTTSLQEDRENSHDRWHPEIPPALRIQPGETVEFEVRDAFDLAVTPESAGDVLGRLELGREHPLTGPVDIEGAEPGDLLEVELLSFVPSDHAFHRHLRAAGARAEPGSLRQRARLRGRWRGT